MAAIVSSTARCRESGWEEAIIIWGIMSRAGNRPKSGSMACNSSSSLIQQFLGHLFFGKRDLDGQVSVHLSVQVPAPLLLPSPAALLRTAAAVQQEVLADPLASLPTKDDDERVGTDDDQKDHKLPQLVGGILLEGQFDIQKMVGRICLPFERQSSVLRS